MGHPRNVDWEKDTLYGEEGYRYQNIFMSGYREQHIGLHTIMDENRKGEHPHGMWIWDRHYQSIDHMIWAYAARCCRWINSNNHNIVSSQLQFNGRRHYRIRLRQDAHIGVADIESDRHLQEKIRGLWYAWTQYADIVFDPLATTDGGHQVYPIVTFFPVHPSGHSSSTSEFIESKNYDKFNKKRFGL